MIKVVRMQITKEQFRTLPKDERALLLLMGHALNQIAVLIKLVTFSTNKDRQTLLRAGSALRSHRLYCVSCSAQSPRHGNFSAGATLKKSSGCTYHCSTRTAPNPAKSCANILAAPV